MSNYLYWIALEQSKGMGPVSLERVYSDISTFGLELYDLFELSQNELTGEFSFSNEILNAFLEAKKNIINIEKDYFTLLDHGFEVIPFFSSYYPKLLIERLAKSFPPILYAYGNVELLHKSAVAILGEKAVSDRGEIIAYMAVKELIRHDIVIASGLAQGVGTIAHRSAIENGGATFGILPSGMFHFKLNSFLKEVFNSDNFLILSPFYPSAEPSRYNAYTRNKYLCALSQAVYIVEASLQNGMIEAATSSQKLDIPLYTTEYGEYPKSAAGNSKLIQEFSAIPVRGRIENDVIIPNMDRIISHTKF